MFSYMCSYCNLSHGKRDCFKLLFKKYKKNIKIANYHIKLVVWIVDCV